MIEVQHLTKRYGRVTAVDDVSFRVERGEILGFLGPNGAGKTTTMRILTGYMPATEGKAIVAGFDVFDQPIEAKRRTGYLPETPPLYPDMTVVEYLDFVAQDQGRAVGRAASARIRQVMERTRIADMADRQCAKLSKGYRQRVGLAQALIHNPDVLILDEPTAGLDPEADHRNAPAHQGARRRSHDHPEHAHPARGLADLPARRHHQQGTRRRGRHARQPHGAAARIGNDVRAGRRRRRRRGRRARARPRRDARRRVGSPRTAWSATKSTARRGRDVRRDLARAVVTQRLGTARAAADAHEPRGDLPVAHDRRNGRARRDEAAAVQERRPMRNILAIAHKELQVVLRLADRLHRHRLLGAALRLLLRRHPGLLRAPEHADEPVRPGRAAGDERQPAADPAAAAERARSWCCSCCRW